MPKDANSAVCNHAHCTFSFQILHAAYKVEITVRAGASVLRMLVEKMKQLMHMMPWSSPPVVDRNFKISVAENMLNSLNSTRSVYVPKFQVAY